MLIVAQLKRVVLGYFRDDSFGSCSKIPLRFVGDANNIFWRLIGVPRSTLHVEIPRASLSHNRDE